MKLSQRFINWGRHHFGPFTGTGFTGARNGRWTPEYSFKETFSLEPDSIMWRMDEHGAVQPYAKFNGQNWEIIKQAKQGME